MPLTPLQQRFVDEYPAVLNQTEAYRRAGGKAKGHSAEQQASRMMRNREVKKAIDFALEELGKRSKVTADMVVNELRRIAFLDPRKVMSWGPKGVTFVASSRLTEDEAACVTEASETITEAGGTIRVKLADKLGALNTLARHLGMLGDKPPGATVNVNVGQYPFEPSKLNDDQLRQFRDLLAAAGGPGYERGEAGG